MLSTLVLRGAYVDAKGIRWDTNDADVEGYLFKQSRWVKGMLVMKYVIYFDISHYNIFNRMEEAIFCVERF